MPPRAAGGSHPSETLRDLAESHWNWVADEKDGAFLTATCPARHFLEHVAHVNVMRPANSSELSPGPRRLPRWQNYGGRPAPPEGRTCAGHFLNPSAAPGANEASFGVKKAGDR